MFEASYYYEKMAEFKEKEIQKESKEAWKYTEVMADSSNSYLDKISKLLRAKKRYLR